MWVYRYLPLGDRRRVSRREGVGTVVTSESLWTWYLGSLTQTYRPLISSGGTPDPWNLVEGCPSDVQGLLLKRREINPRWLPQAGPSAVHLTGGDPVEGERQPRVGLKDLSYRIESLTDSPPERLKPERSQPGIPVSGPTPLLEIWS